MYNLHTLFRSLDNTVTILDEKAVWNCISWDAVTLIDSDHLVLQHDLSEGCVALASLLVQNVKYKPAGKHSLQSYINHVNMPAKLHRFQISSIHITLSNTFSLCTITSNHE